jgi:hypothetical protein
VVLNGPELCADHIRFVQEDERKIALVNDRRFSYLMTKSILYGLRIKTITNRYPLPEVTTSHEGATRKERKSKGSREKGSRIVKEK